MENSNRLVSWLGRIFFITLFFCGSASIARAERTACSATGVAADEVVVSTEWVQQGCGFGGGTLYHIKKTNNQSVIEGCLIRGHFPEGYTFVEMWGNYSCAYGDIGRWYLNQRPIAHSYAVSIPVNTSYIGSAATTDPDGDALSYSNGQSTISLDESTGAFVYTPPQNYEQTDWVSIRVSDGKGGSSHIFFDITVGDPSTGNKAPVIEAFSFEVWQGLKGGFLITASDPELDPVTIELDPLGRPAHGSVIPIAGAPANYFYYIPDLGYVGDDEFIMMASDDQGNIARAVIFVTVKPLDRDGDFDQDGMPNGYELDYGLDPYDSDDAAVDTDADGYSNLVEHDANSDPRDPESTPETVRLASELAAKLVPIIMLILSS